MPKTGRKITGFLWAMILAIISFFIIFIFFPDVSNKFFGVSLKEPQNIGQTVSEKTNEIVDNAVKAAGDKVSEVVEGAYSTALDTVKETAEGALESVSDKVEDIVESVTGK